MLQSIVDQKAAIVASFTESRTGPASSASRESAADFLLEKIKSETLTIASRLNESKSTVDDFNFKQWSNSVLAATTINELKCVEIVMFITY